MNKLQIDALRNYYDNTDIPGAMVGAKRADLGDFAAPDAEAAYTVSMPNGVLTAAREIAAKEGTSTNDVLRKLIEVGVDRHGDEEATVPVSELMRLIDAARDV